jgi:hypothetical protein
MDAGHGTSFQQKQLLGLFDGMEGGGDMMDVPNVLCLIVMKSHLGVGTHHDSLHSVSELYIRAKRNTVKQSCFFWDMALCSQEQAK